MGNRVEEQGPGRLLEHGSVDDEALVSAVLLASRALVAIAARSLAAAPADVTLAQYRLLVLLASRGSQIPSAIATDLGTAPSSVTRLCDRLVTKGLIRSRRGFRGGFRLARPAERITLREIVEALQGPIEFHQCLDHLRARGRRHRCHVRRVFRKVQRKVASILEQTTLDDILQAAS